MKQIGPFLIFLVVNLLNTSYAAYPQRSIPQGVPFASPNGRYSVELQEIDRLSYYAIKDTKSGDIDRSIIMPSLVLYLHWASNSQAIVAVEHVPHGSRGRVVYVTDSQWADIEVRPPGKELMDSAVVGVTIKPDHVHYRFAIRYIQPNGMPIRYAFCDLDVSFETRGSSNIRWTPTNQAEWAASLEQKPAYNPSME
jgi:hypothetical protein